MPDPQIVPTVPVKIAGKDYELLWGPAARYYLQRWGYAGPPAITPVLAFAAAMMGTIADGKWTHAGLTPDELATIVTGSEDYMLDTKCGEAIKNTVPPVIQISAAPGEKAA